MLRDPNHCPHCGCDLTGLYDSWTDRCPLEARCGECGESFDVGRLRSPRHWPHPTPTRTSLPCPECGYDLSGIASSGPVSRLVTCSECGFASAVGELRDRRADAPTTETSATRIALTLLLGSASVLLAVLLLSLLFGVILRVFG
ncbi:MAG: hypothetical protein ACF8Q5_01675 [Phycisphaerales bacterium JB040]